MNEEEKIPKIGDIFICHDNEGDFLAKVNLTRAISGKPLKSYQMQVIDRIPPMKNNGWISSEIIEERRDIRGIRFGTAAQTFWKKFKSSK